jgi:hypothetical protein
LVEAIENNLPCNKKDLVSYHCQPQMKSGQYCSSLLDVKYAIIKSSSVSTRMFQGLNVHEWGNLPSFLKGYENLFEQ